MSVNADQIAADGRCGWENADTIMRMEKNADNKKGNMKKTRNADGKKKQTNKQRKEIFLSSRCHMVGPFTYIQNVMPIVDTVILYPVIPFINVTEIRTLRSSSLNAHIWCSSSLSV